jgi:hypothetical protein
MADISEKVCRENQNTNFVFKNYFFLKNRTFYEIIWGKYGTDSQITDNNILRRMRVARWLTKATDTHFEYVIIITLYRATMVMRTRPTLMFYVRRLCCFKYCQ